MPEENDIESSPTNSQNVVPETKRKRTYQQLWAQYLVGIMVTTISFIESTMDGWQSSTFPKLRDGRGPFQLTDSQISWAASIGSIGSIFTAYFVGVSVRRFGRKNTLILYAPFYLLALLILYFATSAVYLYISKLVIGAIGPIKYSVVSIYLAEIADKSIRGRFGSINYFLGKTGSIITLIVSAYTSYKGLLLVLMIFPIITFFCVIFIPKSPYYKLLRNDRNGAMKYYKYLNRKIDENTLEQELDVIENKIHDEMKMRTSFYELIRNSSARYSLIVVLGLKTIQFGSGSEAIQQYLQIILEQAHSPISTNLSAILTNLLQILGIFSSYFLIDKIGRKPLLIMAFSGNSFTLFICGLYFFLDKFYDNVISTLTWIPLVTIMAFEFIDAIGTQISFVQFGELFSANMKEKATVVYTIYTAIINFLVTKMFGVVSDSVGLYLTFWLCCSCMVIGVLFTVFFITETKQKSLQEIQIEIDKFKNTVKEK